MCPGVSERNNVNCMQKKKNMLAFDIGTGSGRGILGTADMDGRLLDMREVFRFSHAFIRIGDRYYWDYLQIYRGMIDCLKKLHAEGVELSSIGIDSWAQDIAYIGRSGEILALPRCYRDPALAAHADLLEEDTRKDKDWLSEKNGISGGHILTLRQLYFDRKFKPDIFEASDSFVWIAYLLVYLLTGEVACDLSMVALGGLCGRKTLAYNPSLAAIAGAQDKLPKIFKAGEQIGFTNAAVAAATGYEKIPVICVEAHDTSGACSAIPDTEEFLWFSSGSYAMYGAVTKELFLSEEMYRGPASNYPMADGRCCIMAGSGAGMYHIQMCMKEWKKNGITYEMLTEYSVSHKTQRTFLFENIDDTVSDMPSEIAAAVQKAGFSRPESPFEIYEAFCNALVDEVGGRLMGLERTLGRQFSKLYIISGGALADGVNIRLARLLHKEVYTGLTEASALGNLIAQCGRAGNGADNDIFAVKKVNYGL